jgi:subtilisin-like proprotein convertase family protein
MAAMTTPNDPLFPQQGHFARIGDIARAWQDTTGRGVTVAVFDDGVQTTHPDLAGNIAIRPFIASGGGVFGADPLSAGAWHGTAVAGVIGAVQGNGTGGSGVAPGVTLTGLNYLVAVQAQPVSVWIEALRWGGGFDIVNASWGRTPDYEPGQSAQPGGGRAGMLDALAGIAAGGRGGLGTIIVQSAGNDSKNTQGDGLHVSRHTITVSATDDAGFATGYSNWGSTLLVSAPGTTLTTDRTGAAGAAPGDSVTGAGTSFAAPIVSGVVALMLETAPGLGWRDVQNILAFSARQTGSLPGQGTTGHEFGAWVSNGASVWNGGGATTSVSYGYGMVDALAAVRMAEAWHLLHDTPQTSANERVVTATMSGSRPIAELGRTDVALQVSGNIAVEHIEVSLRVTHSWSSDMIISLVAPGGAEFRLMQREGGQTLTDFGWSWTFGVEGARGLASAGTWRLRIEDVEPEEGGTLNALSLRFIGGDLPGFRVHHLTEDFAALAAWEPGRKTIATAGGADRLNLSAIEGDVSLSLAAGGALSVDGAAWGKLAARAAQAVMGDGDDIVTGHDFGVVLHGMRGRDLLVGGLGTDQLFGGEGDDILVSAGGSNLLHGGDGMDTALLNALRRQGTLSGTADGFIFAKPWGTDTLVSVERLVFLDGSLEFDAGAIAAQVARLYQAALGRLPDPFGLAFWTDMLAGGRAGLGTIAQGFLGSAEFATRFPALDDTGFVTLLYANVLGRAPDAGGLAFHTGRLGGGIARDGVLLDFSESGENRGRTSGLIEDGLWVANQSALTVLRTYATVLDRLPDQGGLAFWTVRIAQGAIDYDGLAAGFMGSAEFQARYGALSNRAFVEQLYLNALDRPGDQGGIAFYTGRLDSGAWTRADVVETFAFAEEMSGRLAPFVTDGILFA